MELDRESISRTHVDGPATSRSSVGHGWNPLRKLVTTKNEHLAAQLFIGETAASNEQINGAYNAAITDISGSLALGHRRGRVLDKISDVGSVRSSVILQLRSLRVERFLIPKGDILIRKLRIKNETSSII